MGHACWGWPDGRSGRPAHPVLKLFFGYSNGHTVSLPKRVFLDTNVLHQTWPRLSVNVENTLAAIRKLGMLIEIPSPVMIELQRNWRTRMKSDVGKVAKVLREISVLVSQPGIQEAIPSWESVETGYADTVNHLLSSWNISITPMPRISISDLFLQAAERSLVFGDKGVNFQDAVIFHAAIERMTSVEGEIGAIISDDSVFKDSSESLIEYALTRKVSLRLLKLDEAKSLFLDLLDKQEKDRLQYHKAIATEAVKAYLPQFDAIFNASTPGWSLNSDRPEEIQIPLNADFTDVFDVEVPVVDEAPQAGSEIRVSAIVRGTVEEFEKVQYSGSLSLLPRGRKPIEAGLTALALYEGTSYRIIGILSFTIGWPHGFGGVGHSDVNSK
jgi:hypothetical protein